MKNAICWHTRTPVLEVKAVLGGSLLRDSRGRGSFSFCRRITSVLSSKMLELTGWKKNKLKLNCDHLSKSKSGGRAVRLVLLVTLQRSNSQVDHLAVVRLGEEVLSVCQDVFDQIFVFTKKSKKNPLDLLPSNHDTIKHIECSNAHPRR